MIGDENDVSKINGIIKCRALPPRNLYHTVLPVRAQDKLMFLLCRICCMDMLQLANCSHDDAKDRDLEGTWVSCGLQKSVKVTR